MVKQFRLYFNMDKCVITQPPPHVYQSVAVAPLCDCLFNVISTLIDVVIFGNSQNLRLLTVADGDKFIFKLSIVFGLYLGALYHGLNGMRVVIIDFWPDLGKKQAMLWRIQMIIFAVLYIPSAIIMLSTMFGSH